MIAHVCPQYASKQAGIPLLWAHAIAHGGTRPAASQALASPALIVRVLPVHSPKLRYSRPPGMPLHMRPRGHPSCCAALSLVPICQRLTAFHPCCSHQPSIHTVDHNLSASPLCKRPSLTASRRPQQRAETGCRPCAQGFVYKQATQTQKRGQLEHIQTKGGKQGSVLQSRACSVRARGVVVVRLPPPHC